MRRLTIIMAALATIPCLLPWGHAEARSFRSRGVRWWSPRFYYQGMDVRYRRLW